MMSLKPSTSREDPDLAAAPGRVQIPRLKPSSRCPGQGAQHPLPGPSLPAEGEEEFGALYPPATSQSKAQKPSELAVPNNGPWCLQIGKGERGRGRRR